MNMLVRTPYRRGILVCCQDVNVKILELEGSGGIKQCKISYTARHLQVEHTNTSVPGLTAAVHDLSALPIYVLVPQQIHHITVKNLTKYLSYMKSIFDSIVLHSNSTRTVVPTT